MLRIIVCLSNIQPDAAAKSDCRNSYATSSYACLLWVMSAVFRGVRDESGLPPTAERLRQRSELAFRAKERTRYRGSKRPGCRP
jgi:hypothetical protein